MICNNHYCEAEATHQYMGEHYCDECIHEHVYDDHDPDPSKSTAQLRQRNSERRRGIRTAPPKTKNAGRELIEAALELGMSVAVHYEDDDDAAIEMEGSENLDLLWDEATACDSATVYFYRDKVTSHNEGWAYLIHVNDPDETVSDHSATGWVTEWAKLTDFGQNDLKVVPDSDTESGFKAVRTVKDGEW